MNSSITRVTVGLVLGLALGLAGGWLLYRQAAPPDTTVGAGNAPGPAQDEREVLYWYDPMYPDRHFDAPGKSPFMNMDLVPKYAGASDDATLVQVDPRMVQSLGIRTETLRRGTFWQRIDTIGRIEPNERSIREITVRAAGWVEALHVRAEGDPVARGQILAEIFSPGLDVAQRELLLALDTRDAALIEGAQAQLRALGMSAGRIAALERDRTPAQRISVVSPMDGYVMRLSVREGAAVQPETALFVLVSHDPVWIVAEVPEPQAEWMSAGRPAEVRVAAHPGRVFDGAVDYLYPELERATRTRRARIVLANPHDALHPGMYAEVTLYGGPERGVVLAPTEAVIRTGRRNVVIVAEGEGRYRPVEVTLGPERAGETVILDGIAAGQEVVTSGQFLIDSEASLLGAYQRLSEMGP